MNQMQQYQNLLSDIMDNGVDVLNKRTGAVCRTLVGAQMSFDMKEGFPALTTRKLPFKNIVGELLGFFRGYTSAAEFRALGCNFWDANANETKAWLDNPFRTGTDDLGRIYGKQWTAWESIKMIKHCESEVFCEKTNHLVLKGYKFVGLFTNHDVNHLEGKGEYNVLMKNINQLEEAAVKILTDPSDRRIIVSGWNPGDKEQQSLPSCHMDYRFIPFEGTKTMSVVMTIRSSDFYLGAPANIASTALFLEIMCRLTGYIADKVIIQAANVHLYESHFQVAKELLGREPLPSPTLVLGPEIFPINDPLELEGCFKRINPADITMQGYESHGVLSAPMVA